MTTENENVAEITELHVNMAMSGGVAILHLQGKIDSYVFSKFRDRLLAAMGQGNNQVVLDLTAVENVNTTCIGLLVSRLKECREKGGDMKLVGISGYVTKIFKLIGALDLFDRHDCVGDAIRAFGPQ